MQSCHVFLDLFDIGKTLMQCKQLKTYLYSKAYPP